MATGKKNSTLRKSTPKESKLLATGVKSIKFWHEATAGETSIPFGSLTLPTAISTSGLSNPTSSDLLNSNLALFHNNVEVHSSLNQKLMEGLTYVVKNSQITFVNGYEATEGEIFEVNYKNDTIVGTNVVDARPIRADGVLTVGQTDFNVGEAFPTNKYPNAQIGAVKVYMDGVLQMRNVNNATAIPAADGNYEEVHVTGGFGTIIRFNDSFVGDKVIVVTSEYLAEKPDISQLQLIDSLAGQIDKVIETTAMLAGVPESDFQAAPNNVDLMAFGDKVQTNKENIEDHETRITSNKAELDELAVAFTGWLTGNTSTSSALPLNYTGIDYDSHSAVTTGVNWKFTVPLGKAGVYLVNSYAHVSTNSGMAIYKNGVLYKYMHRPNSASRSSGSGVIVLDEGDYIDIRGTTPCTVTGGVITGELNAHISIIRQGN